jgi:hypothetical protein
MIIADGRTVISKGCVSVGVPIDYSGPQAKEYIDKYYPTEEQIVQGFVLEVARVTPNEQGNQIRPVASLYFTAVDGVIHLSLETRRFNKPSYIECREVDSYAIGDEMANNEYREDLINRLVWKLDDVDGIDWSKVVGYNAGS